MITKTPNPVKSELDNFWYNTVDSLMNTPGDSRLGDRKFFCNYSLEVPAEVWNTGISMTYKEMGYKNNTTKRNQLIRNYFNEEELTLANQKFIERLNGGTSKRSQSCISSRIGNIKKGKDSQGFCMQTVSINHICNHVKYGEALFLDFSYRTTEICQKFLADLKFLQEDLIPFLLKDIDIPLTGIRFHLSTLYISGVYIPLWCRGRDILTILKTLHEVDPRYWRTVCCVIEKLLEDECRYTYLSRVKQYNFFQEYCSMSEARKTRLKKYINRSLRKPK